MKIVPATEYRSALISLLQTEKLPAGDLPDDLADFIVMIQNAELIGVAGIERYGAYALLRSVAVAAGHRGRGIAGKLLDDIESRAKESRTIALFLLTETAADYFKSKGYQTINREEAPETVKRSSQFSHVCPVSAIVMKKNLT